MITTNALKSKYNILDSFDFSLLLSQENKGFTITQYEFGTWVILRSCRNLSFLQLHFIILAIFHYNFVDLFNPKSEFYSSFGSTFLTPIGFRLHTIATLLKHNDENGVKNLFTFATHYHDFLHFKFQANNEYDFLFLSISDLTPKQQLVFQSYSILYSSMYYDFYSEHPTKSTLFKQHFCELFSAVVLFNYHYSTTKTNPFNDFLSKAENIHFVQFVYNTITSPFEFKHSLHCHIGSLTIKTLFAFPTFASIAFRNANKPFLRYCNIEQNIEDFPDLFI